MKILYLVIITVLIFSISVCSKPVLADNESGVVVENIQTHSRIVSFDQKTYQVGDTVTITVNDSSLNTGNDLIAVYSSVPPVDALSSPQDPATDTVGQAGLGTYSDGTPIGILFDVQWGQQDRRWSNSDVPTNKITTSCWGGNHSNTGTPGGFATGLAASGFFLSETAPGSGVFQGTFEIPDQVCMAPAGTTGGPGVSTAVTGMNIKAIYHFKDKSGKLVEVSDISGIRGRPSGVRLVSMSTDKYVYMPGDVVLVKGKSYLNDTDAKISLEKNGKITVITKDIPISKNGTFYANFTIPFDTATRSWWLVTSVGGGTLSQGIHFKSESISPLDQFWSGILPNDTLCEPNLVLIIKTKDGSPACVKPDTATRLVERGWTKMIFETGIAINSYTPISNETENQVIKVIEIKMVPPYTPGGPVIQLTIQNVSTTPITNLNAILETNHNYTFNFQSITSSTPLISGNSVSNTTMLIGGGFQTESTYNLIISGMKDNMPFEYLEKVHIQG